MLINVKGGRNSGVKIAKGDYLIFVDSDDCFLYKNVLSILDKILENNNDIDILRGNFRMVDENYNENVSKIASCMPIKIKSSRDYFLEGKFPCNVPMSCYKTSLLLDNNLYFRENVFYEDTDWFTKVLYFSSKIGFIDFPFYGYRENRMSTTRNYRKEAFLGNILGCVAVMNFFEKENIDCSIKSVIRERNKVSLLSYIRNLGRYKISDSRYCVNFLIRSGLMELPLYKMPLHQKFALIVLKYFPCSLIISLRVLTLLKRFILNYRKSVNLTNSIG